MFTLSKGPNGTSKNNGKYMKLLICAVLVSLGLFDSHQLWSIWSQFFHDEHQCYERKRKKQIYNVEALRKRSNTSKPSQFTIHCFTSDYRAICKRQMNAAEQYLPLECSRVEIKLQQNGQKRTVKHLSNCKQLHSIAEPAGARHLKDLSASDQIYF